MLRIVSKKSKVFSSNHSRLYKAIGGQIALVNCGSEGLGKEICIKLASKGCNIAVVDIDSGCGFAEELEKEYLVKAKYFPVDCTKFNHVAKLKLQVEQQLGPVDILINNAKIIPKKSTLYESSRDDIKKVIQLNLLSYFWTIKCFIPTMKERGTGHIVAISSLTALSPVPLILDYCATQYAIRGLMEALKLELQMEGAHRINTTIVYRGFDLYDKNYLHLVNAIDYIRIFPNLNLNLVADQVVDSILRNEFHAYAPKWAPKYLKLSKWLPGNLGRRFGPPRPKKVVDCRCK